MAEAARVRQTVKALVAASPAFAQLPPAQRRTLAQDMVRVAAYLADPHGLVSKEARAPLLSAVTASRRRRPVASGPGAIGRRDVADAWLAELRRVDFPAFVSGLIHGVFHAIVTLSIQQMAAYAKLVADVASTVDAFREDGLGDQQARDHLTNLYPDLLSQGLGTRASLRWRGDADIGARILQAALHLPAPPADLRALVAATRRRMALQRQQLLATMVLLGIGRIVVHGGPIAVCQPPARLIVDRPPSSTGPAGPGST